MQQLSFQFPSQEKYLAADFIVSSANQLAFEFVENYNQKLPKIFAIFAPKLGGKTYLANIWQKKFNGEFLDLKKLENTNLVKLIEQEKFYIIEDIDQLENQKLFLQIFNLAMEKSAHLMLTSNQNLNQINCEIKDLSSRLKNVFALEIKNPDDDLIKMLLIKSFSQKQLKVENQLIDFLVKNTKRNFAAIADLVKMLEFYSQEMKRNITIPLVKEILMKK